MFARKTGAQELAPSTCCGGSSCRAACTKPSIFWYYQLMNKNEHGFSAVEVLLSVVIIGLVGFVAWYVWQAQQTSNTASTQSQQQTSETTIPPSAYLTLADYKVRIPLNDKTGSLSLGDTKVSGYSDGDKTVAILAPELNDKWTCGAGTDGQRGTIGSVSITSQEKRSGLGEPVVSKKVGDYTYGFESGGANCTASPQYDELVDAFKIQFQQIEAY